ncbi:MAG: hypothetical protein LHV68_09015 [Elusimicrobia bacterium]|nr:hypothetical protein [Candidatus Liberimonas magnetica]
MYKINKNNKPNVRIDGILWDKKPSNSRVVIAGKIYSIGDSINAGKILKIDKNDIEVFQEPRQFSIVDKLPFLKNRFMKFIRSNYPVREKLSLKFKIQDS